MIKRLTAFTAAAFCGAFVVASAAQAQSLPPEANNPAVKVAAAACAGDIQKYCPAVQPGSGRIIRCLAANKDGVSQTCRDSIFKAKAALGL